MNKKILTTGIVLGALALSGVTFAAFGGNVGQGDFSAVQTAVASNNYASLSTADQAKISTTQFADMVTKYNARKAVQDAITAGDYTAFKNAKIAQIPTETEFQKMVTMEKSRVATQASIETAVKNNDFAAYKTAIAAQQAAMAANHPNGGTRPAPTDAQLQTRFNKLVTYYKTNGKLPMMGWMGGGFGGGRSGGHVPRGGFGGKNAPVTSGN